MENIIIGERLKEVREARKMTQEELSNKVGITRASISAFEKGLKFPSVQTVEQLSRELNIPMAYLQNERPPRSKRAGPFSYRKKSRASLAIQNQMSRLEEWLEDIYSVYCNYIEFPELNIVSSDPIDYEKLTDDDIEKIADDLRNNWGMGIGPISNITDFIEANGIVIGRAFLESDIEAVSVWRSNKPHILTNKLITSSVRVRMSIAHELGHLVLHRLVNEEDYEKKETHDLMERQANLFAASFLFPLQSFFKEFYSIKYDALLALKKRWKVSMGAIVMRGKNLDIIDEKNATAFYKNLSMKGFSRRKEPLDNTIPIESIKLFDDATEMLSQNKINLQRIIDESLLAENDFYTITEISPDKYIAKSIKIFQFKRAAD